MEIAAPDSFYFGVEHSATGRAWRARLSAVAAREAEAMVGALGISAALAQVIASRDVPLEGAGVFLEPTLRALLPDPSVLCDLDKAVARLAQAIAAKERIAVFGDYDVDGACSTALLVEYLRHFGLDPLMHIPDRLREGYGPNAAAITALHAQGASVLVCVDCGTSAHEALAHAVALGLDVLIFDHHQAEEILPPALAVVNPNRLDDLSNLGSLCAAGVVFVGLVGLNRALRSAGYAVPDLLDALDLVALATVADVMPLKGLNRAFVRQGLKVMRARGRPGLAALCDIGRLQGRLEAWHLGYLLGPRINAGGRVGEAGLGAQLLLEPDMAAARALAEQLDHHNRERQTIEEAMLAEAEAQAETQIASNNPPVLCVLGQGWHPGVVGIIAGRLKERFRRPAFAFAPDGRGSLGGSGRSLNGVDLGEAVRAAVASGLARKGGGHKLAAGVSLDPVQYEAFGAYLVTHLAQAVAQAQATDYLRVDLAASAESLTPALHAQFQQAAPFGSGNPEPVIGLGAHLLRDLIEIRGGHLKLVLTSGGGGRCEAMLFRAGGGALGQALRQLAGRKVHVLGTLSLDQWGGREKVSLRLLDIAAA